MINNFLYEQGCLKVKIPYFINKNYRIRQWNDRQSLNTDKE